MKRILMINLVIVFVLSIAISANAQHLVGPAVFVDIRDYQELIYGRGGSEGHSGAYIQLTFACIWMGRDKSYGSEGKTCGFRIRGNPQRRYDMP